MGRAAGHSRSVIRILLFDHVGWAGVNCMPFFLAERGVGHVGRGQFLQPGATGALSPCPLRPWRKGGVGNDAYARLCTAAVNCMPFSLGNEKKSDGYVHRHYCPLIDE